MVKITLVNGIEIVHKKLTKLSADMPKGNRIIKFRIDEEISTKTQLNNLISYINNVAVSFRSEI